MAFWMVAEIGGERRAFVHHASSSLNARIRASMSGLKQVVTELRELDAKPANKNVGRVLSADEARALLKRSG